MIIKKYVIGVKHKSGIWCYATGIEPEYPLPFFTQNRDGAKAFRDPDSAKGWFTEISNLFYEYTRKLPAYEWETLCVKEIVESEYVFSKIKEN